MRIGGIEAGGTKMVCAIGEVQTDKGDVYKRQMLHFMLYAKAGSQYERFAYSYRL